MNLLNGTYNQVYKELLTRIVKSPLNTLVENGTYELENVMFQIDPKKCLFKNKVRSSKKGYIASEILWYADQTLSTLGIEVKAPLWSKIKDTNGNVQSNYGQIATRAQNKHGYNDWYWCVSKFAEDKHTRKAVIRFNRPDHADPYTKDFVCTMYAYFSIRNNKLNMNVSMRSNDIILGLPNDIAFFCVLQQNMCNILKKHYPSLELGTYTHKVDSMHLYQRDFETATEMIKHDFGLGQIDIGDFKIFDAYGLRTKESKIQHEQLKTILYGIQ